MKLNFGILGAIFAAIAGLFSYSKSTKSSSSSSIPEQPVSNKTEIEYIPTDPASLPNNPRSTTQAPSGKRPTETDYLPTE